MKTTILRISVWSLAIIAACGTCNATDWFTQKREEAQRRIGNGSQGPILFIPSKPQLSQLSQNPAGNSQDYRARQQAQQAAIQRQQAQQAMFQRQHQERLRQQQIMWQNQQAVERQRQEAMRQQQLQHQRWQMQMQKQQQKTDLINGIFGAVGSAIQQGQRNAQGQQYYQGDYYDE